jgi:dihydropteroate synthase
MAWDRRKPIGRRERFLEAVARGVSERGAALMGICNVTPDSFSDGGRFLSHEAAVAHARRLALEGADVIDIGAESTRPGAEPVSAEEQLRRALPVVEAVADFAPVSIDTQSAEVARACLAAGAVAVNDVSMGVDPALAEAVAEAGAAYVLMHSREAHGTVIADDAYAEVVREVAAEWLRAAEFARTRGVAAEAIFCDPGLGFAKNGRHSFELLQRLEEFVASVGAPVLVGASRKSFLRVVDEAAAPEERLGASIGAALQARRCGARVVRVHDVRATAQALKLDVLLRRRLAKPSEGG